MNKELIEKYQQTASEYAARLNRLRAKSRGFVIGEVALFGLALTFIVLYTLLDDVGWTWIGVLLSLAAYLWVRQRDVKNDRRIAQADRMRLTYERELKALHGDFSPFDAGDRYVDPHHCYTFDMDVFGRDSLYQRIGRAVSSGGADRLTAILSGEFDEQTDGEPVGRIGRYADAVEELGRKERFVARFKAHGVERRIDTVAVTKALDDMQTLKVPALLGNRLFHYLTYVDLTGFYLAIFLSIAHLVPVSIPIVWGLVNFFAAFYLASGTLRKMSKVLSKLNVQVEAYVSLISLIDGETFESEELKGLKSTLKGAAESFGLLDRILHSIDSRGNVLGLILFDAFGLWDLRIVRHFMRWQKSYGNQIGVWITSVNRMDAFVSMGNYRMNEPRAVRAEIVTADKVVYDARQLRHPFLGDKAVGNDFTVDHRNFYIITGANMAGKSTFLRSLGANYLLAMAGLPVFADGMKVSVFRLFTSMRATDDLAKGISYFNAELRRLDQLLKEVDETRPMLVVLDEILKGTNSLDKLNGSRLFLESVSRQNVTGVIATHDLELSKMADTHPDRFHNYCFEIELGETVTYSYRLTPGVARNQNATFLLRQLLNPNNISAES